MIADALKFLVGLGENQANATLVKKRRNDEIYLVNGELKHIEEEYPAYTTTVATLADFASYVKDSANTDLPEPEIWISESKIVALFDHAAYREQRCRLDLKLSQTFIAIMGLESESWMDQKAFVRFLRFKLGSAIPASVLLEKVRRLKFSTANEISGSVRKTEESLGRSITHSIEAETDLPDHVVAKCCVYSTPGTAFETSILLDVEVDPATGRLRLCPAPDAIANAVAFATAKIKADLSQSFNDGEVYLYIGDPDGATVDAMPF